MYILNGFCVAKGLSEGVRKILEKRARQDRLGNLLFPVTGLPVRCLPVRLPGVLRGCGNQSLGAYTNLGAYYAVGIPLSITLAFHYHLKNRVLLLPALTCVKMVLHVCCEVLFISPKFMYSVKVMSLEQIAVGCPVLSEVP